MSAKAIDARIVPGCIRSAHHAKHSSIVPAFSGEYVALSLATAAIRATPCDRIRRGLGEDQVRIGRGLGEDEVTIADRLCVALGDDGVLCKV